MALDLVAFDFVQPSVEKIFVFYGSVSILGLNIAVWISFKMSSSSSSTVVSSSGALNKVIILPPSQKGEVRDARPTPRADKKLVIAAMLPDGLAVGNPLIEQKRAKRQSKNEKAAAKQAERLSAENPDVGNVGAIPKN